MYPISEKRGHSQGRVSRCKGWNEKVPQKRAKGQFEYQRPADEVTNGLL